MSDPHDPAPTALELPRQRYATCTGSNRTAVPRSCWLGVPWCRTFAAATTSSRSRSQQAFELSPRSRSWLWRSDPSASNGFGISPVDQMQQSRLHPKGFVPMDRLAGPHSGSPRCPAQTPWEQPLPRWPRVRIPLARHGSYRPSTAWQPETASAAARHRWWAPCRPARRHEIVGRRRIVARAALPRSGTRPVQAVGSCRSWLTSCRIWASG